MKNNGRSKSPLHLCAFMTAIALIFVSASLAPLAVQAEPKPWIWSWKKSHWKNLDFKPYLEPPKHPHNSQWDDMSWQPEDWIKQRESEMALIRDFYFAKVITGQYMDDTVPVLEVGPAFYDLGGRDKRRVAETFDDVYEITKQDDYGLFMLYDWKTKDAVGVYTQHGLQLQ